MAKLQFTLTINRADVELLGGLNAPTGFTFEGEVSGIFPGEGVGIRGQFKNPGNGNVLMPKKIGETIIRKMATMPDAWGMLCKDQNVLTESGDLKVYTINDLNMVANVKTKLAELLGIQTTDIAG